MFTSTLMFAAACLGLMITVGFLLAKDVFYSTSCAHKRSINEVIRVAKHSSVEPSDGNEELLLSSPEYMAMADRLDMLASTVMTLESNVNEIASDLKSIRRGLALM